MPNNEELRTESALATSLTPSSLVDENTWIPAVPPTSTLASAALDVPTSPVAASAATTPGRSVRVVRIVRVIRQGSFGVGRSAALHERGPASRFANGLNRLRDRIPVSGAT